MRMSEATTLGQRPARQAEAERPSRKWLMRLLGVAAVALAAFLLWRTLSNYSLSDIVTSVRMIPLERFLLAGAFAAASYLCLTGFDWLATRYVGASLPYRKVALASFVSLSLGHSIGLAGLSSGGIRYRYYSRWGMSVGDVAKVVLFCGTTVGLGLLVLGGVALLFQPDVAGDLAGLGRAAALALGAACLALAGLYLVLAAFLRRPLRVRSWSLEMPPVRLALGQLVIGPINFAFVAACLYHVIAGLHDVSYFAVAGVFVIANVMVLITHVPGGLGVIESVVLYLLPQGQLIGALVMFRVIYFLVPLCLGGPTFVITELVFRRHDAARRRGEREPNA
jgi:uncharacterized membrane protein YbhN (UPF0104 family)